ncbi:MAG: DUF4954 family protein [Ignavibacteria bacterium]|nr:DUF4954 family protein [Ignavibacteria bacterium]
MNSVSILSAKSMGKDFIPKEYLKDGKDEYYYRNIQSIYPEDKWRNLKSDEIEQLVKNNNTCSNWDELLVTDNFDPGLIKNNNFFGLVRIGAVEDVILQHHDKRVPVGITDSVVISCDIGDNSAVHNVKYLSHYIIGDNCILSNISEMHTTNYAKFGNGIVKEGEPESVRVWIDVMNETGCRKILPFEDIITADAYLWAKYRDDKTLQQKLKDITQNSYDPNRGFYGIVGNQCVIKNSSILKDVNIGTNCYIKGANKLKNLTIKSNEKESAQIGEGVELVNGIIGYGCHIFYGVKAVRFILGNNSNLKYGARLINSFLGDNSTISCCEVLNNLIFPFHEQHHNNSFLISSVIMGQSNLAAAATIGSNHNSRANDSEIQAGRCFWPGLCSSVKHSCRFASFVLLSKADYPAELNIPLPFSLLNNNPAKDSLEVMPAFWWLYNMFALIRNSWKFQNRDKRIHKTQHIEVEYLAPDTVEEILIACGLIELWVGKANLRQKGISYLDKTENELRITGRDLLLNYPKEAASLEVLGENMEKSDRKIQILKAPKAYKAYYDMVHFYAVKNLMEYFDSKPESDLSSMHNDLSINPHTKWVNLGGQLVPEADADTLRKDIGSGLLNNWQDIHKRYDELWSAYSLEKQKHSYHTLCKILEIDKLSKEKWIECLNKAVITQDFINEQVYLSRKKDYDNPFRQATFRSEDEMIATIGDIEENSFILLVRKETEEFKEKIVRLQKRFDK